MRPQLSATARRLRWALLIALALHVVLLWRYAPNLFERFEVARESAGPEAPPEDIVEITPPPAPPKGRGMVMSTKLGSASPERLQAALPAGLFAKPAPHARGTMRLTGDLDFSRASGVQIVANIVPSAVRLPNINAVSDRARTPKPGADAKTQLAAALQPKASLPVGIAAAPPTLQRAEQPAEEPLTPPTQVPYLLPPVEDSYDVDAAIARAATAAEQGARAAQMSALQNKPSPDYRAMLPQGPLLADPSKLPGGAVDEAESGISTFALDAPVAQDANRAAPDQGKAGNAARQQFFALLTARLKATNVRMLAEAVKAGPKVTIRMKFLVDRSGQVLEITPAEPASAGQIERAANVIRATTLPKVPDTMTVVPVELSFPVEVYR